MTQADLANQLWRLENLYCCRKEGSGEAIAFRPRAEQMAIFRHLIATPNKPAYIIKSRRLGLSTGLNTFQADSATFRSGWRGMLIDQNQGDASKKMHEQIRFAWDSLPREIRARYTILKKNDSEFRFKNILETDGQDSVIWADISGRGGDMSMLHVSEMGPIAALDPKRAKEIIDGSFPGASKGSIVVETTWMGGKNGHLWGLIEPIIEQDPNAEGTIYFFPWHDDPEAIRIDGMVTPEIEQYFKELEAKLGKRFSPEQKKWYAAKKARHRNEVYKEYPSTLEEALRAPVEGAIYAASMDELRTAGRILPFPVDKSALVHTSWDLGAPVNTVTWYFQLVAGEIRVVDVDLDLSITATERVARILSKGYPLGVHLLPHDAAATPTSGKSTEQVLNEAGLNNTRVCPRTSDVWIGIDATLEMFPRFVFHSQNCRVGIERLENYRFLPVTSGSLVKNEPVHDINSHAADALRMIAEGMKAGLIPSGIGGSHGVTATHRPNREVITGYRGYTPHLGRTR